MDTVEEIVISGIAGRFPECENVEEFMDSLLAGVDLVTENDRRFKPGLRGTPKRSGTIPTADKFDYIFFNIPHSQVDTMDPRHRIVLETVYECIVDAGINPNELRGTRTGVYVALNCFDAYGGKKNEGRGTNILGALAANRISFSFDFKGPSIVCDTACSTSIYALVNAYKDMENGEIDYAIVACPIINFCPYETVEYLRAGILSTEGYCSSFCIGRDGYVRSEAVVSMLLQKKGCARRIYSSIVGGKLGADGFKREGPNHPSTEAQYDLMHRTFREKNIDIEDFSYFEAHGTGTVVGDETECRAITRMFEGRSRPLLIGSVKSNMGHSEAAAGLCSVTKCITAIHKKTLPGNLLPHPLDGEITGIKEGELKVVTRNTSFDDGLIGINCFGFGGAIGHIVLKPFTKPKLEYPKSENRLVVVSGRTAEAVEHFFDGILKHKNDGEFLALVDEIHKANIEGHIYRGAMIMGHEQATIIERFKFGRQIWFIYPGLGSQWNKMGVHLLKMEPLRSTFNRCANALKPYNIDLYDLVTSDDPTIYDDIMNCFVAINALQIALTDQLKYLGIVPDGYIGHSLGENACSYAEGYMSPEEAVLLSYSRGYGIRKAKNKFTPAIMAVVGLSYKEINPILPDGIYVSCRNSSKSVTIGGPEKEVNDFIKMLSSRGIFVKKIHSCNLAMHTKYIAEACTYSLEFLKTVFKDRRMRSSKWISSSIPEDEESPHWANYNCAEYHFNSFQNPVLFDQALKHIPESAVVIEVSPHGTLQAILKRELGSQVTNLSLSHKDGADNEQFFLNALGKIYVAGGQLQLRKLYQSVNFPVSRGTPVISPLVKWDHSLTWSTPTFRIGESYSGVVTVNLSNPEYSFLKNNVMNGMIIMAGAEHMVMVWKTFCDELLSKYYEDVPVVIENLSYKRLVTLPPEGDVKFSINIMRKSGKFEVLESGSVICNGNIKTKEESPGEFDNLGAAINFTEEERTFVLKRNDIYRFFDLKGQILRGAFNAVSEMNVQASGGRVEWRGEFASFLENMLQLSGLGVPNYTGYLLTSSFSKIVIDPILLKKTVAESKEVTVVYDDFHNSGNARCIGIAVHGHERVNIYSKPKLRREPCFETQTFVYFHNRPEEIFSLNAALNTALKIVLQNSPDLIRRPRICEIIRNTADETSSIFSKANFKVEKNLFFDAEITKVSPTSLLPDLDIIIFGKSSLLDIEGIRLTDFLNESGFFIYHGRFEEIKKFNWNVVFEAFTEDESIYLLRPQRVINEYIALRVQIENFIWVEKLKDALRNDAHKTVILYSQLEEYSGIFGLTSSLLKEANNIRSFWIEDKEQPFDLHKAIYKDQLNKNLCMNVLKNGRWGTYVHNPLAYHERTISSNASLCLNIFGDLSSLVWEESRCNISQNVYIFYAGLNMLDILYATNKFQLADQNAYVRPKNMYLGTDFAGSLNGKRVMGIVESGGISLQIETPPTFLWAVPDQWTLEEAATVPFSYALCYVALFVKGDLQSKETLLLQMGPDSVSLATISTAIQFGCEVFVTVVTETQGTRVKKMFPSLDPQKIGIVSDDHFQKTIMRNTGGRGVDLILNCMTGEFELSHSFPIFKCLRNNGRYVELYTTEKVFAMAAESNIFVRNYTCHRVLPNALFSLSHEIKNDIVQFIKEGIASHSIQPLPRTVFSEGEVENAFRSLEHEKIVGKVLIQLRIEEPNTLQSPRRTISATQKLHFDPEKSYIIIEGSSMIGLEIAEWMILKGARNIVINFHRKYMGGYHQLCLRKWSMYEGVKVEFSAEDASTTEGSEKLISRGEALAPVGGIFITTSELRESNILQQSEEDLEIMLKSKFITTKNMDTVTRTRCLKLDHFVVFSSAISSRGNVGQTMYGMGNSATESLCEKRRRDNLPGLAIQWGPFNETGSLESASISMALKEYICPQSIASCLIALEKFMLQSQPVCTSYVIPERKQTSTSQIKTPLETVAGILEIKNLDTVDESMSLAKLGMDSLMSVEIIQALHRNFNINLENEHIRDLRLAEIRKLE